MEMDYDLLDINTENSSSEEQGESTEVISSAPSVESPPQVEESSSEDEFDESAPLTAREKLLMERLDKITGENLSLTKPTPTQVTSSSVPVDRNFLENVDLDEVLGSSENLNKLLLSVYNSAMEESSKLSAERILQNLPQIMSTYVTNHLTMSKMAEKFYLDNPDLASSSQTVASVANKIAADHPELNAEQVFDQSAQEARKILRIKAGGASEPGVDKKSPKPAFAPSTKGRVREKSPILSAIEKSVMDLISE